MKRNNTKKKRILITGANGFIGKKACEYFVGKYNVVAYVRKIPPDGEKISFVQYIAGDIKDYTTVLRATQKIDTVLNCAAAKSDEKDSYAVNVLGAESIITCAIKNNVSSIIHISTLSTKIKQKGLYGETKAQADTFFLTCPVPTIILKPSIIYGDTIHGVLGSIVRATKMLIVPVIGSGRTYFYPLYIDDFLLMIEKILQKGIYNTAVYDIGGTDTISLNTLIEKIAHVQNRTVFLLHIPKVLGLILASLLALFFRKPPVTVSNVLGATQDVAVDFLPFYKEYHVKGRSLQKGLYEIFRK